MANSAIVGSGVLTLSASGTETAAATGGGDDGHGNGGQVTPGEITDLDVLQFALTLEKLEYTFYREGLETFDQEAINQSEAAERTGDSAESIRARLENIRDHEEAHVNVLTAVIEALGGTPVSGLEFEFPYDTFDEFIALAAVFEPLGVDAYAGAAPLIDTKLLVPTALSIHSVEANHAAYLRDLNGENPVPQAFNNPQTMDSVVAQASQFIVGVGDDQQLFAVTIENVSDSNTLNTSEGAQPVPLSPGAYAVHSEGNPIFTPGEPASEGLARLAEDGFPLRLVNEMDISLLQELVGDETVSERGYFLSLEGGLPPLNPGESATFYLTATEGEALSFATMFVPSNDAFFSPGEEGISLFSNGSPVSCDATDQLTLWDAGTEENQPPGIGEDTKPNQPLTAINVGPDEDRPVQPIEEVDDEFEYPEVSDVINVTIEPQ
ncbi:spondin domain-containing protein [Halopelagius longus]|nr:spondin domain-containing protein [Halopelagius longus]SDR15804.1 Spondin_N [Halopelagius longus]